MLNANDCNNAVQLLNRVQTTGIQEAQVLLQLVSKLNEMGAELTQEDKDGEDSNPAS